MHCANNSGLLRMHATVATKHIERRRKLDSSTYDQYPLLALSGHRLLHRTCPLSGVKRTSLFALQMSAFNPKRALVVDSAECPRRSCAELLAVQQLPKLWLE